MGICIIHLIIELSPTPYLKFDVDFSPLFSSNLYPSILRFFRCSPYYPCLYVIHEAKYEPNTFETLNSLKMEELNPVSTIMLGNISPVMVS